MKNIAYVTGNKIKFDFAREKLKKYKINIKQIKLDITEIQSDKKSEIAIDKAKKAFEIVKQPLFVTDSYWEIEALNGFPGAYMKYINEWFSADDFINLMSGHTNRRAKVTDSVVYIDESGIKIYTEVFPGVVGTEKYSGRKKLLHSTGWDYVFIREGKYFGEYHGDTRKLKSEKDIWKNFANFISKR